LKKKRLVLTIISLAVLIPVAIGLSLTISNYLAFKVTVGGTPITLRWIGESPNESVIMAGTSNTYEIGISNPTNQEFNDACIIVSINTPSPLWEISIYQHDSAGNPIPVNDIYLSGTCVYFTMQLPIPDVYEGTLTITITFGETCALGDYDFSIHACSEAPYE
jgi:uncharacterized membrane protein